MGRIKFTPNQVREMIALFNGGETTDGIGVVYGCSGDTIARLLRTRLGPLRTARAVARASSFIGAGSLKYQDYREGFEAGYRMALTHVSLHGAEQAGKHCNTNLLQWRDSGLDDIPPAFARSP